MSFQRTAGTIALALWLIALLGVGLMYYVDPAAINMVLGVSFWAIIASAFWLSAKLSREG